MLVGGCNLDDILLCTDHRGMKKSIKVDVPRGKYSSSVWWLCVHYRIGQGVNAQVEFSLG